MICLKKERIIDILYRVSDFLKKHDVDYKRNIKISDISSIKIGGCCDIIAYPESEKTFIFLVDFLETNSIPYKVIGKMTNILASDNGFSGVLVSTKRLTDIKIEGELVYPESGVLVNSLLFSLARMNLGGLEELFGIPGTLGALVHNNGGAGNTDISDALLFARVYSPSEKKILILDRNALKLGYRSSALIGTDFIVLSLGLAFVRRDYREIMQKIRRCVEKRKATQPLKYPSLGSVFKRENGIPVSKLIDESGLKGTRIGGAEISKKHAGFIVNRGGASAKDVRELISLVKKEILKKYGFEPHEEIEFLE